MDKVKMHIQITVEDNEKKMELGRKIHSQLIGNPDYIESDILLNVDDENTVNLYVFEGCKTRPEITI